MKFAQVIKTIDLYYKNGYVECVCGWRKSLPEGYNGYYIANCPTCTPELETRWQRKSIVGKEGNLTVLIGKFIYFVLSNGAHVLFERHPQTAYHGLSTRQADKL